MSMLLATLAGWWLLGVQSVYGGHQSAPCGWPTVAYVEGCTGTLVHPELIVLAAHCPLPDVVKFAEGIKAQPPEALFATTARCEAHPGYAQTRSGHDIAYCLLDEPVMAIPIVPVAAGCERDAIRAGAPVTLVGFGLDERGEQGHKREVVTEIHASDSGELFIGGDGRDTCRGDSGGPVFARIADGTWRQIAVTSHGDGCGEGGFYTDLGPHIAWIEERSGIDITPCHDRDGAWSPGPACGGFALAPESGGDRWDNQCADALRTGPSASCGPARPYPYAAAGGCTAAAAARPSPCAVLIVGLFLLAAARWR